MKNIIIIGIFILLYGCDSAVVRNQEMIERNKRDFFKGMDSFRECYKTKAPFTVRFSFSVFNNEFNLFKSKVVAHAKEKDNQGNQNIKMKLLNGRINTTTVLPCFEKTLLKVPFEVENIRTSDGVGIVIDVDFSPNS